MSLLINFQMMILEFSFSCRRMVNDLKIYHYQFFDTYMKEYKTTSNRLYFHLESLEFFLYKKYSVYYTHTQCLPPKKYHTACYVPNRTL